ncbi:hypothetical protein BG005_006795 [Podila minutissima]|nr:hypothetical protein BG005_006795 [Podila minutissima]
MPPSSRQSTTKPSDEGLQEVHAPVVEDKDKQQQKQPLPPQERQGTLERPTDDRHLTSHGRHHNNHLHNHINTHGRINNNHSFSTALHPPENIPTTIHFTANNNTVNNDTPHHNNNKVDAHGDIDMTVAHTKLINTTSGQGHEEHILRNTPSTLSPPSSLPTLPSSTSSPLSTTSSTTITLQSTPTSSSSSQPNISQSQNVGAQNLHPTSHNHIHNAAINNINSIPPTVGVQPVQNGHLKMSKPTRNTRRPKAMSLSPLRTPFTAPSWVLPPISPFADLGIKLDPRRSSGGAPSSALDARATLSNKVKKDSKDSNIGNANNSNNNPPVPLPDHPPNIFDLIQDNEDESFILWDTPSQPSRLLSNTSSQYQSSSISTTTVQASNMPSSVSASTVASDSTVKRWSGGDFKGKDKSKDASEPTGSTPTSPPENRVIMAATIEKLIERLTSDIDYTFLTDFFLVYRLFITPFSLLKLLIARFQWALANDSSQKHIVRIRTFVTLRHWILSFYEYDFVTSRGVLHKALNRYLCYKQPFQ